MIKHNNQTNKPIHKIENYIKSPIYKKYITFDEIIDIKDGDIQYIKDNNGKILRMINCEEPGTITEYEANWIIQYIIDNNLKFGFEVGSGFGFSSIAFGLGFKETRGKLITMDSYIEEENKIIFLELYHKDEQ